MDITRAQQILNTEDTIQVLHNGSPVWIENVNMQNNMAKVKPLDGQGSSMDVPVTELVEG